MIRPTRFVCLLLLLLSVSCAGSDSELAATNAMVDITQGAYLSDSGALAYRSTSGEGNAVVIFIHGTPGSWRAFADYLHSSRLLIVSKALISIDRPGWGDSLLNDNEDGVLPLGQQSRIIGAWIRQEFEDQTVILVGHSLGASLIARLLVDVDEAISGALLLAGGYDPELSAPRWYNRWAKNALIKAIIGDTMRRSNLEMLWLQQDLLDASAAYSNIETPMTIVQGGKDKLVNPAHRESAKQYWPTANMIYLEDSGHFLPWQQQALIEQAIVELIKP